MIFTHNLTQISCTNETMFTFPEKLGRAKDNCDAKRTRTQKKTPNSTHAKKKNKCSASGTATIVRARATTNPPKRQVCRNAYDDALRYNIVTWSCDLRLDNLFAPSAEKLCSTCNKEGFRKTTNRLQSHYQRQADPPTCSA